MLWLLLPMAAIVVALSLFSRSALSRGQRIALGVVRGTILALVILALARPSLDRVRLQTLRSSVILLRDVSESVASDSASADALQQQLKHALPADRPLLEYQFAGDVTPGNSSPRDLRQTDIAAALDQVYRDTMGAPASQVILLTDGRETRGLAEQAARRIALRGGAVHTLPIGLALASPPRLLRIEPGIQNHVGIPLTLGVTLESATPQRLQVRLLDAADRVLDQREAMVHGKRSMVLRTTPQTPGVNTYHIELRSADPSAAATQGPTRYTLVSDLEKAAVHVQGPPRMLVVDPFPDELQLLQNAISRLKLQVDFHTPEQFPADLGPYATILLSDFSGSELTADQRKQVTRFVEAGGGLVFAGGGNCVPARWKTNELAALLPFAIEEKKPDKPKEKPKVAVCYVLDRSGSMGLGLGPGVSKIDMVKAAVTASLRDLPDTATVSVIAFDAQFSVVVPPTPISQKQQIIDRVATIRADGGTAMAPAIGEGIDQLRAFPGERYMVVLTDGVSTPPPGGDFLAFSREALLNNIHWTSIAVGADAATDLMKSLAASAGGAYFFCDSADKIPTVFIAHSRDVRRKNDDQRLPFTPRPGPAADDLKGIDPNALPELADAIQTQPRPGADILLFGRQQAPLLASWRYGLGPVIAFSSDAKAAWSAKWAAWNGTPAFWSQIIQRSLKNPSPLFAKVASHEEPEGLRFIFTITDKQGAPADGLHCAGELAAPTSGTGTVAAAGTGTPGDRIPFTTREPGVYEALIPIEEGAPSRLFTASLRDDAGGEIPFAAVVKGRRPMETTATGPDTQTLQSIARAGSGLYSTDPLTLAAACPAPQPTATHVPFPLWPLAIALAATLWLLDLALRKFITPQ